MSSIFHIQICHDLQTEVFKMFDLIEGFINPFMPSGPSVPFLVLICSNRWEFDYGDFSLCAISLGIFDDENWEGCQAKDTNELNVDIISLIPVLCYNKLTFVPDNVWLWKFARIKGRLPHTMSLFQIRTKIMLELRCWTPDLVLQVSGAVNHESGYARLAIRRLSHLTSPKMNKVKI